MYEESTKDEYEKYRTKSGRETFGFMCTVVTGRAVLPDYCCSVLSRCRWSLTGPRTSD